MSRTNVKKFESIYRNLETKSSQAKLSGVGGFL